VVKEAPTPHVEAPNPGGNPGTGFPQDLVRSALDLGDPPDRGRVRGGRGRGGGVGAGKGDLR